MYIIPYYFTIISLLYVLFFLLFFLLFHYYSTIILIIFPIIFDYFRGSHPNFEELADNNSRPMLQAMTDKCPGAPATLQDERASSLYEARSTDSAEKRLLYALFLVLYLLF